MRLLWSINNLNILHNSRNDIGVTFIVSICLSYIYRTVSDDWNIIILMITNYFQKTIFLRWLLAAATLVECIITWHKVTVWNFNKTVSSSSEVKFEYYSNQIWGAPVNEKEILMWICKQRILFNFVFSMTLWVSNFLG